MSAKLCFVGVKEVRAHDPEAGARKQSFQDKGVTKLELGHEEILVPFSVAASNPSGSKCPEISQSSCSEFSRPVGRPKSNGPNALKNGVLLDMLLPAVFTTQRRGNSILKPPYLSAIRA